MGTVKCANCALYSPKDHSCNASIPWWARVELDMDCGSAPSTNGWIYNPDIPIACESYRPIS